MLCQEYDDYALTDDRDRAVLQEFNADFHALGQFDGADEEYQTAIAGYKAANLATTTSFDAAGIADAIITFTEYITRFADNPGDDVDLVCDFAGRVEYKRRNIDQIVEALDNGEAPK